MRRASILVAAVALILLAGAVSQPAAADVSFGFFYSNLSPYGTWAVSAHHGRVWQPYLYEAGWNPYYDGHWVYTDFGWTWVSDYRWGAIPYHYGTWALDPYLGWVWIPGYVWAPSWVVFSSGPDYIGWAPVPPRFVVGAPIGFRDIGHDHFVIVPARSFLAPRVRSYIVPRATARTVLAKTRIVNNITVQNNVVVNRGPDPRSIEKVSGKRIRPEPIDRVKRIAPDGRFDMNDVRADRNDRGAGGPRATSPEPVRASESARRPAPPSARRPAPPSDPQAQRGQVQTDQRGQVQSDQSQRGQVQSEQQQAKPGKTAKKPAAKPPASEKPAKPPKPPGKPG